MLMDQNPLLKRENRKENQENVLSHSILSNNLLSATTPVPNALLDQVMPTLRDTELRVLLVVVRQTRGWQDGPNVSQRKERDWLTQSQLMGRTGRGSGAVAHAVEALVQVGLIEVQDRTGRPLNTPSERRRHLGRLYYRLGTASGPVSGPVRARVAKIPATKSPVLKNVRKSIPKSAHAKSHTTKETENKINKEPHKNVDKPVDNSHRHEPEKSKPQRRKPLIGNPLVVRTNGWEHIAYLRDRSL